MDRCRSLLQRCLEQGLLLLPAARLEPGLLLQPAARLQQRWLQQLVLPHMLQVCLVLPGALLPLTRRPRHHHVLSPPLKPALARTLHLPKSTFCMRPNQSRRIANLTQRAWVGPRKTI